METDYEKLVRAFREDEEEDMTQKSKSKTRRKQSRTAKLTAESSKGSAKNGIIRATKEFEQHTLHHHKRKLALRGELCSTRFRKACANFRQAVSEI